MRETIKPIFNTVCTNATVNALGYSCKTKIMRIGYIRRKDSQISNMAQIYIDELKKCSINII